MELARDCEVALIPERYRGHDASMYESKDDVLRPHGGQRCWAPSQLQAGPAENGRSRSEGQWDEPGWVGRPSERRGAYRQPWEQHWESGAGDQPSSRAQMRQGAQTERGGDPLAMGCRNVERHAPRGSVCKAIERGFPRLFWAMAPEAS